MVAAMNDGMSSPCARKHMKENGIADATDGKPRLASRQIVDEAGKPLVREEDRRKGRPVNETYDVDTNETFDKKARSKHLAEQSMEKVPSDGERVVAQSPSQPCCAGCHAKLSQPDANGQRPIDKIPSERQQKP